MRNKIVFYTLVVLFTTVGCSMPEQKPKIAFTFDDGSTKDILHYPLTEWNQLILDNLDKHDVKAAFFVAGSRLANKKGEYVLSSWDDAGHMLGNHTYYHPNYNKDETTAERVKQEILLTDSLLQPYKGYSRHFRFPYLKAGKTVEKRDSMRFILKELNYKHGYVSIDASDWYVNSLLIRRLKKDRNADLTAYKQFYIQHLYERALYYDSLAFDLTGRKIKHNLLLHHNLSSALFLDELIEHFKIMGWEVIDAQDAFLDEIYAAEPNVIPAGESIVWSLAKESGKYKGELRYPAEDSRYEKAIADSLGL